MPMDYVTVHYRPFGRTILKIEFENLKPIAGRTVPFCILFQLNTFR